MALSKCGSNDSHVFIHGFRRSIPNDSEVYIPSFEAVFLIIRKVKKYDPGFRRLFPSRSKVVMKFK
ncbi:hypothetical protein ACVBAX_25105 [Robertmurraya sp. GLU-23]